MDRLRRLPFDYYGRYRLAAEVVGAVTEPGARVLDVGGGPGALSSFVDQRETVSVDVAVPTDPRVAARTLVLADGAALPFPDEGFDAVVSLDTLEHVRPESRATVLGEALRVARGWVLVVCPCATAGVAEADSALLAYLRQRFGEAFPSVEVLTEHLSYGHPDPDEVVDTLSSQGAEVVRLPSGRMDRWLPMMVLFYELMALGRDDPVERVQAWYNALYWRDDLRGPSYRQAFLVRKPQASGPSAAAVAAALLPAGDPVGDAVAFEALDRALREPLRSAVSELDARVRELESELARTTERAESAEARALAAEEQSARLEAFRARVLAHPLVRLRNRLRGGPA